KTSQPSVRIWLFTGASANPALVADRQFSASPTRTTNPTTARHVRLAANCWRIAGFRGFSARTGREHSKSWRSSRRREEGEFGLRIADCELRIMNCASAKQVVFDNAPQSADAVLPPDLLALFVGSASIRNADLEDSPLQLRHFCRDLRFETEPVLFDHDLLQDFSSEDLVASLHVGQVQIGERIRAQRQQVVANGMPEIQDAMGLAAGET